MDDEPADGDDPSTGPPPFDAGDPLRRHWDDLMGDAAATAAEYRERDWDVLELHPGDVTAMAEEEAFGLDVLVPDDEHERLASWVAEGRFDEFEVYRAESGLVFLLVVARDGANRRAVCCPAYYGFESAADLAGLAESAGRFHTRVRRLSGERVTFTHEDPGAFFPDGEAGAMDEGDETGGDGT